MFDHSMLWEFLRKFLHLSGLLILLTYTVLQHYFGHKVAILGLTLILLVLLQIDYWRVEHQPKVARMLEGLFREKEKDHLNGAVFFLISCVICFSAFDYWVAVLAMGVTVFGDLFSALFGKIFGESRVFENRSKTYVGTVAGLAANVAFGLWVLEELPYLALLMALVASIVELFTHKLDDNLTVPLFAGFAGQLMVYYSGYQLPEVSLWWLGIF